MSHWWRQINGALICGDCGAHLVVDVDMRTGVASTRVVDGPWRCGMRVFVPCPVCKHPFMVDNGHAGAVCRDRRCAGEWPPRGTSRPWMRKL